MAAQAAALLLAASLGFAQSSAVRVAGLGPPGASIGDGGPATQAILEFPTSVALDAAGNLYLADEGEDRIRKVGTNGVITTIAGNGGYQSGPDGSPAVSTSISPYGVAVDSHGTVYFGDSHQLVRKIAADGTVVTVAGFLGAGLGAGDGEPATAAKIIPWGIAIDRSGNLYIADRYNYRIREVTTDGIIHTVAGTGFSGTLGEGGPAVAAQLADPTRVALDTAGNLYIADGIAGNRILRVGANGILTRIAGGGLVRVDGVMATTSFVSTYGGISVDAAGNVYTADWDGNTIRKITTDGIIHTIAGTGQQGSTDGCGVATAALFYAPEDVTADAAGDLYTGERGNPRVRFIAAAGSIRTVAGPGPPSFSGDGGPANQAAIASPSGLAFDGAGNWYLADSGNNRIRQITPAGIINTVAGAGGATAGDFSGCTPPAGALSHPTAVAAAASGAVYIADTGNHRVMLLSPNGALGVFAGTGTKGFSGDGGPAAAATLNAPSGLAVDSAGNIYIADTGNNRVRTVGADGNIHSLAPAFSAPAGLAFDSAGNLYVAESVAYRVTRMKPDGTLERIAGTGFNTASAAPIPKPGNELADAVALALDSFGSLYVADASILAGKLQRITRNCALSNPTLTTTSGVAADGQSNIYYSDPVNNVVWQMAAAPPPAKETPTPSLAYQAFLNAATLLTYDAEFNSPLLPLIQTYAAAPGEMVRIRGICLGPFDLAPAQYDSSNLLPRTLAGVSVLFDQTPAPLISAQAGEIWAVVPSSLTGATTSDVTVQFNGGAIYPSSVKVLSASPGIFSLDGSGTGQAAAVNADGTINGPANPAARGSLLAFWATGQGVTNPAIVDGQAPPSSPLSTPVLPVTVAIGGQPAEVVAAALAPDFAGALQVNVLVPTQIPAGPASLVLTIGGVSANVPSSNPYDGMQTVTISVK